MAQSDFGTIDPSTTSGVQLANILSLFQTAVETNHSGTSRPAYVKAGMTWLNTTTASANVLNFWSGSIDIPLFTINTLSGAVTVGTPSGGGNSAPAYALASRGVNTTGSLQGGGTLADDRSFSLLGDSNSPSGNCYYGTDANGSRGYHVIQAPAKAYRTLNDFGPGTYYPVIPAGCYTAWFQIYAGGGDGYTNSYSGGDNQPSGSTLMSGGWGAACYGGVAVTPGETLAIRVGAANQDTYLYRQNTSLVFASAGKSDGTNGSLSVASGLNISGSAPLIRNGSGAIYGSPGVGSGSGGQPGYASVEFNT